MGRVATKIACPRCQRSYVIKVDAVEFCARGIDAVCARCGQKFDAAKQVEQARIRMAVGPDPSSHAGRTCGEPDRRGAYHETPEPEYPAPMRRQTGRRRFPRPDGTSPRTGRQVAPEGAQALADKATQPRSPLETPVPLLWRGGNENVALDWTATKPNAALRPDVPRPTPWGDD